MLPCYLGITIENLETISEYTTYCFKVSIMKNECLKYDWSKIIMQSNLK